MAYFTQDYLDFFKELSSNNNRDWFQANKKRYTTNVRGAFIEFTAAIVKELENKWGPISNLPRDFLMRINRDIRFSKDKTPYNLHLGAMISPFGKRNMTRPGLYIKASNDGLEIYTGCYLLEKENLLSVRQKIAGNLESFDKMINKPAFVKLFGEVRGEKHKRLPKELLGAAERQPLLYNKGFYYGFTMPAETILSDELIDTIIQKFNVAEELNNFLDEAID